MVITAHLSLLQVLFFSDSILKMQKGFPRTLTQIRCNFFQWENEGSSHQCKKASVRAPPKLMEQHEEKVPGNTDSSPMGFNIKLSNLNLMVLSRSCLTYEVLQTHVTRMMFPQGTAGHGWNRKPQRGSMPGSGCLFTRMEKHPKPPKTSICFHKQQKSNASCG